MENNELVAALLVNAAVQLMDESNLLAADTLHRAVEKVVDAHTHAIRLMDELSRPDR